MFSLENVVLRQSECVFPGGEGRGFFHLSEVETDTRLEAVHMLIDSGHVAV